MFDWIEVLRENHSLRDLLGAYAATGHARGGNPWLDRIMDWEQCKPAELARWHGFLLAAGWLETRVGAEVIAEPGQLRGCYRVTSTGKWALRRAADVFGVEEETIVPTEDEATAELFPRQRA